MNAEDGNPSTEAKRKRIKNRARRLSDNVDKGIKSSQDNTNKENKKGKSRYASATVNTEVSAKQTINTIKDYFNSQCKTNPIKGIPTSDLSHCTATSSERQEQEGKMEHNVKNQVNHDTRQSDYSDQSDAEEVTLNTPKTKEVGQNTGNNSAPSAPNKTSTGEKLETHVSEENSALWNMIKNLLNTHKDELKTEITNELKKTTEERITKLETTTKSTNSVVEQVLKSQSDCTANQADFKMEIKNLKDQVNILSNVVIRQGSIIQEMHDKTEAEDLHNMKHNLIVRGILETPQENCLELCKDFFKTKMVISDEIGIVLTV